jgi:steroid delta-isomerase-like uncharacterized protein
MSVESNKALGTHFFMEQDRLRGGPNREICTDGYRAKLGGNPAMDFEGHKQFAGAFYSGFPDLSHTIEETVADEDKVAVRFTIRGTNTAPFMGMPPTNKPIEMTAIAVLRIEDGKVAEINAAFDEMGLMRQLGVIPSQ